MDRIGLVNLAHRWRWRGHVEQCRRGNLLPLSVTRELAAPERLRHRRSVRDRSSARQLLLEGWNVRGLPHGLAGLDVAAPHKLHESIVHRHPFACTEAVVLSYGAFEPDPVALLDELRHLARVE